MVFFYQKMYIKKTRNISGIIFKKLLLKQSIFATFIFEIKMFP